VSELQTLLASWLTELAAVLPFGFAFGVGMVAVPIVLLAFSFSPVPALKTRSTGQASRVFILCDPLLIRELPGVFLAGIQQALEELTPLRRGDPERSQLLGED
jgi:hypothetical protein